eukprot:888023-Pyramimonas_sp.AAC.1
MPFEASSRTRRPPSRATRSGSGRPGSSASAGGGTGAPTARPASTRPSSWKGSSGMHVCSACGATTARRVPTSATAAML